MNATPEQLIQQEQRRLALRKAIVDHLADQPQLLRSWLQHQPLQASMRRQEPDSIVAVVNINRNAVTAVRTLRHKPLRKDDTQWLNPQTTRCPNTGALPQEATIFGIMAEPILKAVALTHAGWNDCWVLQQPVDDHEDNPQLAPLKPTQTIQQALQHLPNKTVLTPPANLVARP